MTTELINISGHENRFKRVGRYDMDTLLRDLRDFQYDVDLIVQGINSGALQGPVGPPGPKGDPGEPGFDGINIVSTQSNNTGIPVSMLYRYAHFYGLTTQGDPLAWLYELYALIYAQSTKFIIRDYGVLDSGDDGSLLVPEDNDDYPAVDEPTSFEDYGSLR